MLANTIRDVTKEHLLKHNGLLFGQCVSAVGWVAGTVPKLTEQEGIIELPTSDVSNGGIVVGAALAGRKPIYVVRYQGFLTYNLSSIVNYAAKSIDMWGKTCPIFLRAIGMEGGIGPVATGMHHSMAMRYPGMSVHVPLNSLEWRKAFNAFYTNSEVVFCSEHRSLFNKDLNIEHYIHRKNKLSLVLIGPIREHSRYLSITHPDVNIIHLNQIKPLEFQYISDVDALSRSKRGVIVIDSDYQICGAAEHIAMHIQNRFKVPTYSLGVKDKVAGFGYGCDVVMPTANDVDIFIQKIKKEKKRWF